MLTLDLAQRTLTALADAVLSHVQPNRLVVGLSGGADSTLTLLVACKIRERLPACKVVAVHCVHGLDDDDPIWLEHCVKLCRRLKVDLKTPRLNIIYGNGVSPEESSRNERYKALMTELHQGVLMMGHQADDQIENVLLALKRGSGPKGLAGMRLVTTDERGTIVRPLLNLSRSEIEDLLKALGYNFVFDISNTYLKFERNFLRLKVLPLLRSRFSGIDGSILRSAKLCAGEHELAMRVVMPVVQQAVSDDGIKLNLSKLNLDDETLCLMVIKEYMATGEDIYACGADYHQLKQIYELCKAANDRLGGISFNDFSIRRFKQQLFKVKERQLPPSNRFLLRKNEQVKLGDYCYSLRPAHQTELNQQNGKTACNAFVLHDEAVMLDFTIPLRSRLKIRGDRHHRELYKLLAMHQIPAWERGSKCAVRNLQDDEILAIGDLFALELEEEQSCPTNIAEQRWQLYIS